MLPFSISKHWVGVVIATRVLVFPMILLATESIPGPESPRVSVADSTPHPGVALSAKMEKGIQLRRERRDREALALFREAFIVEPSARVLAQIALAEQAVGEWVLAEQDLIEALKDSSAWIEDHRAHLQASLEAVREHLGSLIVTSNVSGSRYALNGTAFGRVTAQSVRVPVGTIMSVVEAPGYYPGVRTASIEAGATAREAFELDPRTPVSDSTGVATPPRRGGSSSTSPPHRPPIQAHNEAKARNFRTLGWSLVAASGVLLTGAILAHIAGEGFASEYNDDARCIQGDLTRGQRCGSLREKAHVGRTLAVLGYEAALGTGVIAGVLFERAGSLTPGERPIANGFGVAVKGTW